MKHVHPCSIAIAAILNFSRLNPHENSPSSTVPVRRRQGAVDFGVGSDDMHLTGAVTGGHRWRSPSTCSDKKFKGHPNML